MKFETDRQTLEDLSLLGKYKNNSLFSLFNHTVTRGGEALLESMFLNPFTQAKQINIRSSILSFFQQHNFSFPFTRDEFDVTEHYLGNTDYKSFAASFLNNLRRKAHQLIANDKEYGMLQEGMSTAVSFIKRTERFMSEMKETPGLDANPYRDTVDKALGILGDKKMSWAFSFNQENKISFWQMALCDHRLRYSHAASLNEVLQLIHELDVYLTVSSTGRKHGFAYARALEGQPEGATIEIKELYHPCIPNAVTNDIHLESAANVLFLTGANMAGKSTLMKSFGIAVYLAHMGFPVAAMAMSFSVQQGLYTSINVPDDLNMGYSHFYAEVVRVKKIAVEVASGKHLVVMFDELFKGTNVKDAYDATVAITGAFAKIRECAFIVSTHIMEAGMTLKERSSNIQFKYLPTIMKGSFPQYTYSLDEGISNDRHGMRIINNEKIIETIKGQY